MHYRELPSGNNRQLVNDLVELTIRQAEWRDQAPDVEQGGEPTRDDLDPGGSLSAAHVEIRLRVAVAHYTPVGEHHHQVQAGKHEGEVEEAPVVVLTVVSVSVNQYVPGPEDGVQE